MSKQPRVAIACYAAEPSDQERELSTLLQVPLLTGTEVPEASEFFLRIESAGLTLYHNVPKAPGGLRVDFAHPDLLRRSSDKLKQQNLLKAVGLKGTEPLHILDAMAGLGRDAWLLASGGAKVQLLENSAVVFALLQDGFTRGQTQSATQARVLQRMHLRHGDFFLLADELPQFDVVYLDPMFPATNKQARAKKDMYLLQLLLGNTTVDEFGLLNAARKLARRRVVVKRAKLSPHLAGQQPDIEFKGSANRYDVYLSNAAQTRTD